MHQSNEAQNHILEIPAGTEKSEVYKLLAEQAGSLFEDERDFTANMANCAALIYHTLPDLNWAGFYILRGDVLVVGPFQGKPACVRIALGKGVCGTSAQRRETIVVPNVHQFSGHIACDSASQSEVVIPLIKDGQLFGVLDLDSPLLNRFDAQDAEGLEMVARRFIELTDIPTMRS